jgi:hypothetical protein
MKSAFLSVLVALLCALSAPVHAETGSTHTNPAVAAPARATASTPSGAELGSRAEDRRYASREAASPDAKQYRGGDVLVISATTIAIILLVIVIIILL